MNSVQCSVYLILFALLLYSFWYNLYYVTFDPPNKYPMERLKLLTNQNMLLDTIFFGLCFMESLFLSRQPKNDGCFRTRIDKLYCSLVFPLGYFTSIMFWGIYAIDRELVLPKSGDAIYPWWLNHVAHSLPIISVTVENVFQNRMYSSRKECLKILIAYAVAFCLSLFYYYFFGDGLWIYPFLTVMNWPGRIAFMIFGCFCFVVFYFLGEILHYFAWDCLRNQNFADGNMKQKAKRDTNRNRIRCLKQLHIN